MTVLTGITSGFSSVGIVVFLSERAPLGQTATILAIFASTLRGLIAMVAGPLAGIVFDVADICSCHCFFILEEIPHLVLQFDLTQN